MLQDGGKLRCTGYETLPIPQDHRKLETIAGGRQRFCRSNSVNGEDVKTEKETLSETDYEGLANLRYTLRRFMDFSASAALAEGLPSQQHQALLAIKGHTGPITIGTLASRLMIAPHSATELVGRLNASGLVDQQPDPQDKRRQTLMLTEKAERVLLRLSATHLKEIRDLAPELITILQRLQEAFVHGSAAGDD